MITPKLKTSKMCSTTLRLCLADRWKEESVDHRSVSNLVNTEES